MATLKIYPGSAGMRQSLEQVEELIAAELKQSGSAKRPRNAVSMLSAEEEHQGRGRRVADLLCVRDVLEAHLDLSFTTRSLEAGREALRAEGAKQIKSCGWCWTSVRLRGGLLVKLQSPYLRRERASRKKRCRGQAGVGIYPLLSALGFEGRLSPASRAEIARQSVLCGSYEEAREQLGRSGLELDLSTLVRTASGVGRRALELRDRALEAALASPLPNSSSLAGKRVRVSLDGGRARTRQTKRGRGIRPGKNKRRPFILQWREPRVLTVDVLDERGEVERRLRPLYEATLGQAEAAMKLLAGTLRLLGLHLADKVLFVADGAGWIWRRIASVLLDQVKIDPGRLFLALDYYHVTEHIAEALSWCKDLRAEQREALRRKLSEELLEPDGAEWVIERLRSLARGRRAGSIKQAIDYLQGHLELLDYSEIRAQKLSIGSGVVESAIRRLVNLRFKAASMCWRADHLEPLLYLRAILKARRWDQFFPASLQGRHWLDPTRAFVLPAAAAQDSAPARRAQA